MAEQECLTGILHQLVELKIQHHDHQWTQFMLSQNSSLNVQIISKPPCSLFPSHLEQLQDSTCSTFYLCQDGVLNLVLWLLLVLFCRPRHPFLKGREGGQGKRMKLFLEMVQKDYAKIMPCILSRVIQTCSPLSLVVV